MLTKYIWFAMLIVIFFAGCAESHNIMSDSNKYGQNNKINYH